MATVRERILDALERAGKPQSVAQVQRKLKLNYSPSALLGEMTDEGLTIRVERGVFDLKRQRAAVPKAHTDGQLRGTIIHAVSFSVDGGNMILHEDDRQYTVSLPEVLELFHTNGTRV